MLTAMRNTLADLLESLARLVRGQGAGGPGPVRPPPPPPEQQ